jgi:hypothetical protein
MRACAFLTLDHPGRHVIDDGLVEAPLAALGWRVESVSWRAADVDWGRFDAVVIRSTWDYTADLEAFLAALARIDASGTRLWNALDAVRWNARKTYLGDLERRGVAIVPTAFRHAFRADDAPRLRRELGAEEIVLKPAVGAGAARLHRLARDAPAAALAAAERDLGDRAYLAQPFAPSLAEEGETSLVYFDGAFSHAVRKLPAPGEFRVQERHGATIRALEPSAGLVAWGRAALDAAGFDTLYARVDLVRGADGRPALMELELIEPALFFRAAPAGAEAFARALDRRARRAG